MNDGFVYVLSNESIPFMVKIGRTSKHPLQRANELQSTGVASPFKLEFAVYSSESISLEFEIHRQLDGLRYSKNREFFKIDPDVAIERILSILARTFDHDIVAADLIVPEGTICKYAMRAGVCAPNVIDLLEQITDEEWKALASRISTCSEVSQR
jgi:hypothetical protein